MKVKRKIIRIDEDLCDGCGQCVPSCAEGAIEVKDGRATVIAEKYCDGLGACLKECPKGALSIEERTADDFDAEAVEERMADLEKKKHEEVPMACGCPSTQIRTFAPSKHPDRIDAAESRRSALSHWPVQIRLVPPAAPFLKGAHLLVSADCAAVASPDFHEKFLKGRVVLVGCPKFDDVKSYVEKFRDIFRTAEIKSVLVLDMEVPCCSALPRIVAKGMEEASKQVPMEEIVLTPRGEICKRSRLAA
ncbi:MAG: 4Fe-4S dicluster domain-containing protein [Desulfobacteraceae bacterium]|nr:MAG: 4Fe-4S dicluster domain-containing protein [Desulfobacteraceae bacterium]